MWGEEADLLHIPSLYTWMTDSKPVPWCSYNPISLNNGSLKRLGGRGWGKAESLWQTFPFFHLTFVVLLVVLLRGEACGGMTGIQLTQMSPVWEQSHDGRLRVHSLSLHNAWEDDNRVGSWGKRLKMEGQNKALQIPINYFSVRERQRKKKKLQVTRNHVCKLFNHLLETLQHGTHKYTGRMFGRLY